jgi:hypothetical protein
MNSRAAGLVTMSPERGPEQLAGPRLALAEPPVHDLASLQYQRMSTVVNQLNDETRPCYLTAALARLTRPGRVYGWS